MADSTAAPSRQSLRTGEPDRAGLLPPFAIWACAAIFFWSISVRYLLSNLMPAIALDLQLSNSMAGFAIAGLLLGYCTGSWAGGYLPGSRKGRILAGMFLSVPAAALIPMVDGVWGLLAVAPVMGFGVGVYFPLGISFIVDVGGEGRKAPYMALHEVAASLASFSGSIFVAVMLARAGWRGSMLLWCIVGVVGILVFTRVRDETDQARRRGRGQPVPLGWPLAYSVLAYATTTILLMGLIAMLPLIMVRAWGVDPALAASVVGYTRLAGLVGVATVAVGANRWGRDRVILGLQTLSLAGGVAMSLNGYGPLFLAGMVAMAVGASGAIALVPLIIAGAYPDNQRERALAVTGGVGGFIGMVVSPALFGVLLDAGLPTAPIMLAVAGNLVAILVTRGLGRGLRTD